MDISLSGRTALITGASSGIGAHLARLFVANGARVAIAARRTDRLAALVDELGKNAVAIAMDVTTEASIVAGYDAAEAAFGTIDTVIANAGIVAPGRSSEIAGEAVAGVIATNFTGVYLTAREGARRMIAANMRESERGRIVLIGSITAETTANGDAAYAAAKAGVAHLGQQFAREWARQGINVNTVQPGYIDTDIQGGWFETAGGQAQLAEFPRRRFTPLAALDAPVLFFAGDASRHVTGATLTVDDGQAL